MQMRSYLACLRPSARFALVRTSLRGSCSSGPGWWPRAARLINSWLVTPVGLVDVTSKVPVPGRRVVHGGDVGEEDVCLLAVREGLGPGRRDVGVGVEVVDDRRLDVLVRLVSLVRLEAVGHEVVAVPHLDGLLGLRVLAAMRARSMRLVVVAGQRKTES